MTNRISVIVRLDKSKLESLQRDLPDIVGGLMFKLAGDCDAFAKQSMEGIKTGRVYGTHRASAPGESPAVDTGELKNSIGHHQESPLVSVTTVGAEHGLYMEFGTIRMAAQPNNGARPFLLPAFRSAIAGIPPNFLEDEIGGL